MVFYKICSHKTIKITSLFVKKWPVIRSKNISFIYWGGVKVERRNGMPGQLKCDDSMTSYRQYIKVNTLPC